MNKNYEKIKTILEEIKEHQDRYHRLVSESNTEIYKNIINQIPDGDSLKKDLIRYSHSLGHLDLLLSVKETNEEYFKEKSLRNNLLKKLEELK